MGAGGRRPPADGRALLSGRVPEGMAGDVRMVAVMRNLPVGDILEEALNSFFEDLDDLERETLEQVQKVRDRPAK